MALVTMQHLTSADSSNPKLVDEEDEQEEELGELINIPSPAKQTKRRLLRQGSVSENFFSVKGAALILPRQSSFAQSMEVMQVKKFGGDLQTHLYGIFNLIRPEDNIKLAVRLESWTETRVRYLVIVSTIGRQDTDESIIVGMDFQTHKSTECTIGLVIPIWSDTTIKLNGDGGFQVKGRERTHTFKPVSVQAMWSALQALHKCVDMARQHNYYYGSLFLTWTCYYESRICSPRLCLNEWEYSEKLLSMKPNFFEEKESERMATEMKIRNKLKEVMMKMDLDHCSSKDIREGLEKVTDMDLKQYKQYIDAEMLVILGQMDVASKILDFLYLGSEWNASNLEELTQNKITHILNITMEIDNFFPENIKYKNVRCYDLETTDLLHRWNDTYKFIKSAKRQNGKCLVHCKMGISRSAATVSAFLMKENHWSMEKALAYVTERREIAEPNSGFVRQLREYEGILNASSQRHNLLFRSRSESNLSEHGATIKSGKSEDTPSQSSNSTSEHLPSFDLNRKLLDLTVLPYRSVHTRPKSWSPEDAKRYDPDEADYLLLDQFEDVSLNQSHMSEPHGYFTPIQSPSEPPAVHAQDRRRKWRRRNTERIFTNHRFDAENTQSDDSVFANPGEAPAPRIDSWMLKETVALPKPKPKRKVCGRLSSPAAMQTSGDRLDIKVDESAHSSRVSPMNSPSYQHTKNVSVADLKSRFDDVEAVIKVELREETGSTSPEGGIVMNVAESAPKSVVVREIVAVIESPTDENKDEGAEGDLEIQEFDAGIPSLEARERSFSENQAFFVKNRVSEIESRYSTDPPLTSGSSDDISGKENTETSPAFPGISRSQSLPTRRKKPPLSPPLHVLPVIEDMHTEGGSSPLRSLDENMNVNNNNNGTVGFSSTTVIQLDNSSRSGESLISKAVSQPGCSITKKLVPAADPGAAGLSRNSIFRTLTQTELQVIREVGKTFLSDSEEGSSIFSSENSSSMDTSLTVPGGTHENVDMPAMKRGVVRRMARIIECKMKQQHEEYSGKTRTGPAETSVSQLTDSTTVINKLLMGESTPVVSGRTESGQKWDPVVPPSSIRSDHVTAARSSQSGGNLQELLTLAGPTPYSPVHTPPASTAEDLLEKMPSWSIRPVPKSSPRGIRRTQSERSVGPPFKKFPHKSRVRQVLKRISASKSHPELNADSVDVEGAFRRGIRRQESDYGFSFYPVKEIVQNIEKSGKTVEVTRSSSLCESRSTGEKCPPVDQLGHLADTDRKEQIKFLSRSHSNPQILADGGDYSANVKAKKQERELPENKLRIKFALSRVRNRNQTM